MTVALNTDPGTGFEPCDIFRLEVICSTLASNGVSVLLSVLGLGCQVESGTHHPPSDSYDPSWSDFLSLGSRDDLLGLVLFAEH